jgi:AcrR family transcriptional regulator
MTDVERVVPAGTDPPATVPPDVFAAAVEAFTAGQRLDMRAIAHRVGVGRATLYRHAGNREQLLDELIWWRARHALVEAVRRTGRLRGVPRLVAQIGAIMRGVQADPALQAFLAADPETALRIVTGSRSRVQRGMTAALEAMIDLETERGHYRARMDTAALAYAIVRVTEGFLYADAIADRAPDIDRALTIVEALLTGLDTSTERDLVTAGKA